MISRVAIKNFKSIGEPGVDLELKPLTLLVGPNGGGKSSILEAIAVASQRDISGKLTSFPSWASVVHKPNQSQGIVDVYFALAESGARPGIRTIFDATGKGADELLFEGPSEKDHPIDFIGPLQSNAFLISSVRGDVPYSVDARGTPQWVGVHGENLLLLLAIAFGPQGDLAIAKNISNWAARFGVSEINPGFLGGNQSGAGFVDNELKTRLDLALSSSGARQIMTIITQLFWTAEGSLLMIEEPEISLHPKAQIDVLEMFAEAIREDHKQILATTHSHILLQALGYMVHKGWLAREDIAVYHVEKRKTGTTAKALPLGKNGYIRNWVPSYTKVERQLLLEWAKTLPRK